MSGAPLTAGARLYWEVARRGFRRYASYRGATLGGLFTNTVFGFMRGYVLIALLAAAPGAGGYDTQDALTYVWITQGLIMVVGMWGWQEVSQRVRDGSVATDLCRPCDFQGWHLAQYLGRSAFQLLGRGIPPFVIGSLFFDLRLPERPELWLGFPIALVLGCVAAFAVAFMVNLASFWLLDDRGVTMVSGLAMNLLSGFALPIAMFPSWFSSVANALPFVAMIQIPIDVFLGKHTGTGLLAILAFQLAWAVGLLAMGRALLAAATTKLVVQGG